MIASIKRTLADASVQGYLSLRPATGGLWEPITGRVVRSADDAIEECTAELCRRLEEHGALGAGFVEMAVDAIHMLSATAANATIAIDGSTYEADAEGTVIHRELAQRDAGEPVVQRRDPPLAGRSRSRSTRRMGPAGRAESREPFERLDAEFARFQGFGSDDFDSLSVIIGASDLADALRKLYRFVVASLSPGPILGRAIERAPADFEAFCLHVSAYREFVALVDTGTTPREASDRVIQAQRRRVLAAMEPPTDRDAGERNGVWMWVDADVYGADDELDLGAVRAEIDRLLDNLHVDRARIAVSLMLDE